jgi:hypothetical protein
MLVGVACDAIMVTASVHGMTAHPFLGFDAHRVDRLYELQASPRGVLAQICVGSTRRGLRLEGSVVI